MRTRESMFEVGMICESACGCAVGIDVEGELMRVVDGKSVEV